MHNLNHNDARMEAILQNARAIAVVGHSDKPHRTSYQIAQFLRRVGYDVYPVNPTVETIDGERSYPSLADVPVHIDIVNVFRRSEHLPGIVDETIQVNADTLWTQLGVIDTNARDRAIDHGINVAMDRCIKIDHQRLGIRSQSAR